MYDIALSDAYKGQCWWDAHSELGLYVILHKVHFPIEGAQNKMRIFIVTDFKVELWSGFTGAMFRFMEEFGGVNCAKF